MKPIFPKLVWHIDQLHKEMIDALCQAYDDYSRQPDFKNNWVANNRIAGTQTSFRNAVALGKGGNDRRSGGFWRFALKYEQAENQANSPVSPDQAKLDDRCSFERYNDFQLYSGTWHCGHRKPILAAEVEAQNWELFGELSNLISVRAPVKYLLITEDGATSRRLDGFCDDPQTLASDWEGTTYFVMEIPCQPSRPRDWVTHRCDVACDSKLEFHTAAAS